MIAKRRIIAVLIAAVVSGPILALSASVAEAKTCQTPAGHYDVTPPARSGAGADPAAVASADCTLGFREQAAYPLSVIVLCVLATAGTLMLVGRNASYDAIGSEA